MNKNVKVVTINGFRGMAAIVFVVSGLIAGFVVSPGFVFMKLWNHFFGYSHTLPLINLFQGIILWTITALILYLLNNKQPLVQFGSYKGLSPEQIDSVIKRAKEINLSADELKAEIMSLTPQKVETQNEIKGTEEYAKPGSDMNEETRK